MELVTVWKETILRRVKVRADIERTLSFEIFDEIKLIGVTEGRR